MNQRIALSCPCPRGPSGVSRQAPLAAELGRPSAKKIPHVWGQEEGATPELKQGLQSRRNP